MTDHTISVSASGEFRPTFSAAAVATLRAAALRWVEQGKPDYIPAKPEKEATA